VWIAIRIVGILNVIKVRYKPSIFVALYWSISIVKRRRQSSPFFNIFQTYFIGLSGLGGGLMGISNHHPGFFVCPKAGGIR
jgi:hypothetical protein